MAQWPNACIYLCVCACVCGMMLHYHTALIRWLCTVRVRLVIWEWEMWMCVVRVCFCVMRSNGFIIFGIVCRRQQAHIHISNWETCQQPLRRVRRWKDLPWMIMFVLISYTRSLHILLNAHTTQTFTTEIGVRWANCVFWLRLSNMSDGKISFGA